MVVLILSTACPAGTPVRGMRQTIQEFAARIVLEVITVLRLHDDSRLFMQYVCTKGQSGTLVRMNPVYAESF